MARMGALMAASHASMRDDFEITVPAIDQLVEILQGVIGKRRRRAHGPAAASAAAWWRCCPSRWSTPPRPPSRRSYRAPSGEAAKVYVCHPSAGAGEWLASAHRRASRLSRAMDTVTPPWAGS